MFAAVSSQTLRYFGFDDCVASCKSANTHLFGLDEFTVHMYIASNYRHLRVWPAHYVGTL